MLAGMIPRFRPQLTYFPSVKGIPRLGFPIHCGMDSDTARQAVLNSCHVTSRGTDFPCLFFFFYGKDGKRRKIKGNIYANIWKICSCCRTFTVCLSTMKHGVFPLSHCYVKWFPEDIRSVYIVHNDEVCPMMNYTSTWGLFNLFNKLYTWNCSSDCLMHL